jgi:hypothetical protein
MMQNRHKKLAKLRMGTAGLDQRMNDKCSSIIFTFLPRQKGPAMGDNTCIHNTSNFESLSIHFDQIRSPASGRPLHHLLVTLNQSADITEFNYLYQNYRVLVIVLHSVLLPQNRAGRRCRLSPLPTGPSSPLSAHETRKAGPFVPSMEANLLLSPPLAASSSEYGAQRS